MVSSMCRRSGIKPSAGFMRTYHLLSHPAEVGGTWDSGRLPYNHRPLTGSLREEELTCQMHRFGAQPAGPPPQNL